MRGICAGDRGRGAPAGYAGDTMGIRLSVAALAILLSGPYAQPAHADAAPAPALRTAAFDASGYPWPAQDGWALDGHGYWEGECTSFVAWALRYAGRPRSKCPGGLGKALHPPR